MNETPPDASEHVATAIQCVINTYAILVSSDHQPPPTFGRPPREQFPELPESLAPKKPLRGDDNGGTTRG